MSAIVAPGHKQGMNAAAGAKTVRLMPVPGSLLGKFPHYSYDYVGTTLGRATSAVKEFGKFKDKDEKNLVVVSHDMGLAFFHALATSVWARSTNGNGSEDIKKYAPAVICVPSGTKLTHGGELEPGMSHYTGTAPSIELNDRTHLIVLDEPGFLRVLSKIANECRCGGSFGEAFARAYPAAKFEVAPYASIFKTAMVGWQKVDTNAPFYKAMELYSIPERDMTS